MKLYLRKGDNKCTVYATGNWRNQYELVLSETQRVCWKLEFGCPSEIEVSPAGKMVWVQNAYGHHVLAWEREKTTDRGEFDHV